MGLFGSIAHNRRHAPADVKGEFLFVVPHVFFGNSIGGVIDAGGFFPESMIIRSRNKDDFTILNG